MRLILPTSPPSLPSSSSTALSPVACNALQLPLAPCLVLLHLILLIVSVHLCSLVNRGLLLGANSISSSITHKCCLNKRAVHVKAVCTKAHCPPPHSKTHACRAWAGRRPIPAAAPPAVAPAGQAPASGAAAPPIAQPAAASSALPLPVLHLAPPESAAQGQWRCQVAVDCRIVAGDLLLVPASQTSTNALQWPRTTAPPPPAAPGAPRAPSWAQTPASASRAPGRCHCHPPSCPPSCPPRTAKAGELGSHMDSSTLQGRRQG